MQKLSAGKFHFTPPSRFTSFDHLVGAAKERKRYSEAECPSSLEIDHQLDLRGLLDRQVRRLLALENATGIDAGETFLFSTEPASLRLWRKAATGREYSQADAPLRNPMTGIADCCARAASGHVAAPPRSVMNSRRIIELRARAKDHTLAYR
jgi:hypothetical protein